MSARPTLSSTAALLALVAAAPLQATVLKALEPARLTALRAQEPSRAALVARGLEAEKATIGLGAKDALKPVETFTDAYGRTHVRFEQTYDGVKVWNGRLIGHVDAADRPMQANATVQPRIGLPPAKLIGRRQIEALGSLELGFVKAGERTLHIEPVVFPTKYQGGLKLGRSADGTLVHDKQYSVNTPRKQVPYVWAYHVRAMQGLTATEFILDGQTGEVLQKWDGAVHSETPVVGTGRGQYVGEVPLDTVQLNDGSGRFELRDGTRGSLPSPMGATFGIPGFSNVGNQVYYYDRTAVDEFGMVLFGVPFTKSVNEWGDGQQFVTGRDAPGGLTGETAAVDAHHSVSSFWDYLKNIFGRDGVDGKGTSVVTIVHETTSFFGNGQGWDIIQYIPGMDMMIIGDGGPTGAIARLEHIAHEMAHGVISYTSMLNPWTWGGGEASGINEANSDIHSVMARYYQWGAGGQGSMVPDTVTAAPDGRNEVEALWTYGRRDDSQAPSERRLYRPSLNGGYDAWFSGISGDASHYVAGPAGRAFYFLSQGAASSGDKSSLFLPAGMAGIGNDKAIRIWFNALTTKLTDPLSDYRMLREAMLASAAELFPGAGGADSAEVAAVKNAFGAINVGAAAGAPEPVKVTISTPDQIGFRSSLIIIPAMVPVTLPSPAVENAGDTSVRWSLGGLSLNFPMGGKFLPDGRFVSAIGGVWPVKATSNADPRQFAAGLVFSPSMDSDLDTEPDACDMIAEALTLPSLGVYPSALEDPHLFVTMFNNAFGS
jgi:Zn-dependent metalloprotease